MNGSVTPKVIGTRSPGSGLLAMSSSRWFCQKHSPQATSSTAGFVDPGFVGNLTLELSNVANLPVTIYYGMPIGQISFMRMDSAVERPYGSGEAGSKYQDQAEPTPSRFYLNFKR